VWNSYMCVCVFFIIVRERDLRDSLMQGSSNPVLEDRRPAQFSSNPDQTHLRVSGDPEDLD